MDKLEKKIKDLKDFIKEKTDQGTANYLGKEIREICGMVETEQLRLHVVSERLNSIDFAKHLETLTPVNRISVHPNPRTLGVDEIYDKYKRQQERNAR
jgi:hypothetical protein